MQSTTDGPVAIAIEDGIARITLDDGKANALNDRLLGPLDRALDRAEAESAALLIAGRTGFFSGGLDLKTLPFMELGPLHDTLALFAKVTLRLFTFPRPVVAASSGHAIAGGTVLLLGADERFGADGKFRVGLNETAINLTLPRYVVEMARAQLPATSINRVVIAGELFSPQDAKVVGLYDHVVAPEELQDRALARARVLAALPERAYKDNKLMIREGAAKLGREAFAPELDAFMKYMTALRGA